MDGGQSPTDLERNDVVGHYDARLLFMQGFLELSMKPWSLYLMQLFTVNTLCNWNLKHIIGELGYLTKLWSMKFVHVKILQSNDCLTTQQRLYREKIEESPKNPEENQEFRGLQKKRNMHNKL